MRAVEPAPPAAIDGRMRPALARRVARSPGVACSAGLLSLVALLCLVWPFVGRVPEPVGGRVLDAALPPLSPGHLLGTDLNGNDVWSRLLHGARTSLAIAVAVNALGLALGGLLGIFGAYRGGVTDAVVMRTLDVLIAFPSLVIVIAVAQALGPSRLNTIWALAFFAVPAFARIARAETLRLREQPFMLAAALSATRGWRVVLRHIGPNVMPQLASYGLLAMGVVILIEGALSFLGLGVPPPAPSLGNMIAHGQQALSLHPRLALLPSALLFVIVLSFNVLGEALRRRWSLR